MSHESKFVQSLLDASPEGGVSWLGGLRDDALESIAEQSPPTRKHEEWRFSEVKRLTRKTFSPAPVPASSPDVSAYSLEDAPARIVFVNGRYEDALSSTGGFGDGVYLGSAAGLDGAELGAVQDMLGQTESYYDDVFSNANRANLHDIACVVVAPDVVLDTPVHVLYVSTRGEEAWTASPRSMFVVGQSAKLSIVEEYRGEDGAEYFNNAVTEVVLRGNARVNHVRVQRESSRASHVMRHAVRLGADAHYDSVALTFGAEYARNDVYTLHEGQGTWCRVDGVSVTQGDQLSDTHSVIDHTRAHCESHQLHKCIVDGDSHAIFNGKIFVRDGAQKVDAYQLNRNLLLSPKARVDTKPQLEIFADDVKCTHGATVGQLDEDQLFYLVSRGFDRDEARNMLTYAFAAEVLESIQIASLKAELENLLSGRLHSTKQEA